jgi:F-type H+-transporting ATPase subunit delta
MRQYSEVSKRYAKALFEITGLSNAEDTLTELRKIHAAVSNPKIHDLLCSPVLSRKEKVLVIDQVLANLNVKDATENLLKLMASKDRMALFEEVVACFETISDEKNNVLRGKVCSASELSKKEKAEVEGVIAKFTGNQLLLEYKEDPELIGGILAEVGSYTFDGSLRTQLLKLKEQVSGK